MLPRRIAMLTSTALIGAAALSGAAWADEPADGACATASPSAVACVGAEKASEAAAAACRSRGPEDTCATATPFGRDVRTSALAAYRGSWVHRAAAYQFRLGDTVPLRDAQWLGTHNSYNANVNGVTPSHGDSNQQLTLGQQLAGDVRSLELDVHLVNGVLRVCHARPASEAHAGCTTEPTLADTLPEIRTWIDANPGQVLLLYLEDHIGTQKGYDDAGAALDAAFGARLFRTPGRRETGCHELPLDLTRRQVAKAGAQVLLVGKCQAGWSSHVFGWTSANEVETGNSTGYTCEKPVPRADYAGKMVRIFEDGTWLSTVLASQENMAANRGRRLTPDKVAAMVRCGVNLFGFDHFDPTDGRIEASVWSWARGEPSPRGACAVQRTDSRWESAPCTVDVRPAACRTPTGWVLTVAVAVARAPGACRSMGATFDPPRTGEENAALRAVAGDEQPWLAA